MKIASILLATVSAFPSWWELPTNYESENFITSIDWKLSMDSVMGGGSLGAIEQIDEYIHFTGELDLIDGGFAGFVGYVDSKLTGYEGKGVHSTTHLEFFQGLRVSGRTPNTDRTFKVGVSRDNDGTWYHPLALENEFKSFEVKFDDFYFSYHGRPNDSIPPPLGSQIRKVRINISDEKPGPFEADINIIQGV